MTIHDTATDVLDAIGAVFAAEGVDLPARQYVASGDVAIDCEQLVAAVSRVFPGVPGQELTGADLAGCRGPRVQVMEVYLVRCVPVPDDEGAPPSAGELDASAAELLRDADLLLDGLLQHFAANKSTWNDVRAWRVGDLNSYGPEGGFGGWRLVVEVQV